MQHIPIEPAPSDHPVDLLDIAKERGSDKLGISSKIARLVFEDCSLDEFNPLTDYGLVAALQEVLLDSGESGCDGREGALMVLDELCKQDARSAPTFIAFCAANMPLLFDLLSDTEQLVRRAAEALLKTLTTVDALKIGVTPVLAGFLPFSPTVRDPFEKRYVRPL
uniref:Uncharacterized protein n=1 Tax=Chromera velia CCMP2878 TaxID=1169474 RepID=A0A0G4FJU4_9ALVE|eukprot:Cvel_17389.t1-p1 / transcript=Cvel_17389.t1 / gene=Cvel_17389 / organism=Chromera_velia_CCMP2878 / gene_product=hypothetical protein / transcript_product=hypothetical protein / location=Cvel_scaffold1384:14341-15106(-) / protein_length=165 / sequence_SO=supercontig / SO=protein_coding / is_pseudo=false